MTIMVLLLTLFPLYPRPVGPAQHIVSIYSVQPAHTSFRSL